MNRRWPVVSLLAVTVGALVAGIALWVADLDGAADVAWACGAAAASLPLLIDVTRSLLRREPGVDLIALLAIAGALVLGEYLAGSVIAVMLATGRWLEAYAAGRAERELSALLSGAPRTAHRYEDGELVTVPVESVAVADRLLVKPGEVVPVDGVVIGPLAILDESALTGESRLVERTTSEQVRSGGVNAGAGFDIHAVATAEESTYAGIVRLVREAQEEKAPFVRMADRYAVLFVPLTLIVAGAAWIVSGSSVRALSVLVVATPCPLLLAAPIAIVAGISRAARRGVIVKNGGALETVARGTILLFDKTGTLTAGTPRVASVEPLGSLPPDAVLELAASLDQVSPHVLAAAIVRASRERTLDLTFPADVREVGGAGIEGRVGPHGVRLGAVGWVAEGVTLSPRAREIRRRSAREGSSNVFVSVDGVLMGAIVLDDPIRPDTPRAIRAVRRAGIERVAMITGDHPDVAETVGTAIGVDRIYSERSPTEKVDAVRAESADGVTIMVGDGINDAPALAAADVGVAMGARGATASSEAADVVVMVDRLDRLADLLRIARRTRSIALQSVLVGMGLSLAAMVVAAFGYLPPVAGAILQEAIDVAVIVNALRALGGDGTGRAVAPADAEIGVRYQDEHRRLRPMVDDVRTVADRLDDLPPATALEELRRVRRFLEHDLLPHEDAEETIVYPAIGRVLGSEDPMASMSRGHMEIHHLSRVLAQLVDDLPDEGPGEDDLVELRRVLYGLFAVLRLHFAQEDEAYLTLVDSPT
jgi:heavy metal translocating P-type ATPase